MVARALYVHACVCVCVQFCIMLTKIRPMFALSVSSSGDCAMTASEAHLPLKYPKVSGQICTVVSTFH